MEQSKEQQELKTIRPTDNKPKACDGVQPSQEAKPLELDGKGLPIGVKFGGDE